MDADGTKNKSPIKINSNDIKSPGEMKLTSEQDDLKLQSSEQIIDWSLLRSKIFTQFTNTKIFIEKKLGQSSKASSFEDKESYKEVAANIDEFKDE